MQDFQKQVEKKGEQIFSNLDHSGSSIFNRDWWYGRIMDWSMKNAEFKTQMFRFVDVLPYLQSGGEVARHLKEYFSQGGDKLPSVFNIGLGFGSLAPGLMAGAIRKNVTQMARMFITGENPKDAMSVLKKSRKNAIGFTVDLLGEACLSEDEAREYQSRYIEMIDWLTKDSSSWPAVDVLDTDYFGDIPRVNVSVKITALYSQIKVDAWEESKAAVKDRLRPIFDLAMEKGAFINLDMEKYEIKDLTKEIFMELLMEDKYKSYRHWGLVVQAYLRDSFEDVKELVEFSKKRGVPFSIRLVKGAYWDYETISAEQHRWPIPVYTIKAESDANYENCAKHLLDNYKTISLAIGSHNVRSIASCLVYAEKQGVPKNAYEVQMLYGMADPIKKSFVAQGYRVREYAPVGELIPGMAYLVRRLLENTSNESFLKSKFADEVDDTQLMKDPSEDLKSSESFPETKEGLFYNQALLDFALSENREKMLQNLKDFRNNEFGKDVLPIVNGEEVTCTDFIDNLNPSNTSENLGRVGLADKKMAEDAITVAKEYFPTWSNTDFETRATYLEKMADIYVRDRFKIMACQILEAGKTWKEADGDVTEAVDFLRYYAMDMRKLGKGFRVGHAPGEFSHFQYKARGVNVVIAPWNFPLAILTGMAAGALVTGNTVIVKPAEQTSLTGRFLMDAAKEAGVPGGALHFLPGKGEVVGAYLAEHKDTAQITFTGSKEVGLSLIRTAAQLQEGQRHIKKCVAEMGGKNALIIDSDADLDEAVAGAIYSAFGFQGQKCSAASRIVVLDEIYDRFVDRLESAVLSLKVGPSEKPENFMGPVIDDEAHAKVNSYLEIGEKEGRRLRSIEVPSSGHFVAPTVFVDIKPEHRLANEEIFGPITAVIRAKDLDHAIEITNSVEYGLTAGIFSRSPANIEIAKVKLDAGNVYINRGITGAMVERHPFGGFKLSGTGAKTGGPEYLKQFMDEKVVIENTVRRGFAPMEDEDNPANRHAKK